MLPWAHSAHDLELDEWLIQGKYNFLRLECDW